MKLPALLEGLETLAVAGAPHREITAVVCDSRQVRPGALFVAVPGSQQDGSAYVADALQRGAAAIVQEHPAPPGRREACFVQVPDARRALGRLAAAFHGQPGAALQLIGITGTNGKTTCAYMIRELLRAGGRNPGMLTTVEYAIGPRSIPARRTTPDAPTLQSLLAQMVSIGCRSAVMEVSSHALDQRRVEGLDFDVAVFTNLGRDHLDYHRTPEAYFAAKRRLFEDLGGGAKRAWAVYNADDPWTARLPGAGEARAAILRYGIAAAADVRAEDLRLGSDGARFRACTPWGAAEVRLPFLGRHNVSNALAAITAAGALGLGPDGAAAALARLPPVPGRLQPFEAPAGFTVFVDYAHTADALENTLATLRPLTRGQLIVVFGCGGDRDTTKRAPMGAVAARLADYAILTSDNPRREDPAAILAQIREGFGDAARCEAIVDRAAAIRAAVRRARPGDIVLVAGKGHETFQEFASTTVPFDDRAVVARELAAL